MGNAACGCNESDKMKDQVGEIENLGLRAPSKMTMITPDVHDSVCDGENCCSQ